MINVEWKENGKRRYRDFLSELFVEEFIRGLEEKGCTEIVVTPIIQ